MPLIVPNIGEQEDTFIQRCMAHDMMNSEYPDQEQRAAVCHSQWRRRTRNHEAGDFAHYSLKAQADYVIREEIHQGRRHLVVPVIMMVEGVHSGSHGPLLHLGDEMGRFPGAWNGIPVVVNHPQEDGQHISANDPDVIDGGAVGRVYRTAMENGKLKAEAWLDEAKLAQVSPEALAYIREGRPLDVSIGVFTDDEPTPGVWRGENYTAVARNHRPDHLALLPGGTGACSWDDGCGVRTHEQGEDRKMKTQAGRIKYSGTETTAWNRPSLSDFGVEGQWGGLSATERARVAAHFLIGTGSAETFGDLKLPVVNPKTGKLNENALRACIGGRGAAVQGVSPSELSSARRMAYRMLNDEFDAGLTVPQNLAEVCKEMAYLGLAVNEMGFREIGSQIQGKLDNMDTDTKLHFLEECFEDYFVYHVETRAPGGGSAFYRRTYAVGADGSIEFTGEALPVVKKVEYVTANQEEKEVAAMAQTKDKPCCPEKVELLIQSADNKWAEGDREFLLALTEEQLEKLTYPSPKAETKPAVMTQEQAIKVLQEHLGDPEKFLALLPAETRGSVEHGLKLYKEHRARIIQHISANSDGVYTAGELDGMSMEDLEKLAKIVKAPTDYTPLGPTPSPGAYQEEGLYPPGVE